jgi:hypothetical protein
MSIVTLLGSASGEHCVGEAAGCGVVPDEGDVQGGEDQQQSESATQKEQLGRAPGLQQNKKESE